MDSCLEEPVQRSQAGEESVQRLQGADDNVCAQRVSLEILKKIIINLCICNSEFRRFTS